jgi:hypothetical protein
VDLDSLYSSHVASSSSCRLLFIFRWSPSQACYTFFFSISVTRLSRQPSTPLFALCLAIRDSGILADQPSSFVDEFLFTNACVSVTIQRAFREHLLLNGNPPKLGMGKQTVALELGECLEIAVLISVLPGSAPSKLIGKLHLKEHHYENTVLHRIK